MRLRICALAALVITSTATLAEDAAIAPSPTSQMSDITAEMKSTDWLDADVVLLGREKTAPLCPPYCAPRRVTSPAQATVGEREVLAITMAAATAGPKLHVDSRRSTVAAMEKLPSALTPSEAAIVATQNEFRPALDPVLAEPTTDPAE